MRSRTPNRRKRERVGQRIKPGPTDAIATWYETRCPLCMGWTWLHQLDVVPFEDDAPGKPRRPWDAEGIDLRSVAKYPRCPDTGRRGFAYRRGETVPRDLAVATFAVFASRAMAWLCAMRQLGAHLQGPAGEQLVDGADPPVGRDDITGL